MFKTSIRALGGVILIFTCLGLTSVIAEAATPLIRNGSCPSGYSSSGNYCVPYSSSAKPALAKNGSCPSGYSSSGNYCLAYSENPKIAIPKSGSCPSGYSSSGNYCVSYR